MRFSRDRRGQSVVVGTVILFGFLIVALGVYQVQVVPTENADVEFEHSQAVEDDFGDLRNDVLRAGSTGSTGSTQIRLGTRYPPRTFFINPPPVSGSLSTEATGAIRVRNAMIGGGAHPNAAAFWNTSPAFPTRSLRYDADYNELRGTPELVYEHSVIAAEFDDAVLLRSGQTAVSEGRISLTALTGSASESGVQPRNVDARAVSASDTTVPLEPTGGQITLDLPTAVDNATALAARWNDALPAGATATPNATGESIRIALTNGSDPYRLALSEVSIDDTGDTEPAYVIPVGSESAAVGDTVRVEVRDRYNNPVPDATVAFGGENRTTGDEGQASFEPTASGPLVATIKGAGGPSYESVTFNINEGGSGPDSNRTFNVTWLNEEPVILNGGSVQLQVEVTDLRGNLISDSKIDYSYSPLQNGGTPSLSKSQSSDQNDGTDTVNFNRNMANPGDEFDVYASAGDDADVVRVVVAPTGNSMADRTELSNSQTTGSGGSEVTFDISNTGGTEIEIDGVSVDSTSSSADRVSAPGGNDELSFSNGGSVDSTLQIGDSETILDTTETIAGGQSSSGTFNRFRSGPSGGNQVDMSGESVTLTLYFVDGSARTYTLNIS